MPYSKSMILHLTEYWKIIVFTPTFCIKRYLDFNVKFGHLGHTLGCSVLSLLTDCLFQASTKVTQAAEEHMVQPKNLEE